VKIFLTFLILILAIQSRAVSNSQGVQADNATLNIVSPTNAWEYWATNDPLFSNAVVRVAPAGGGGGGVTNNLLHK